LKPFFRRDRHRWSDTDPSLGHNHGLRPEPAIGDIPRTPQGAFRAIFRIGGLRQLGRGVPDSTRAKQ